jgi:hypothetical protein
VLQFVNGLLMILMPVAVTGLLTDKAFKFPQFIAAGLAIGLKIK